MLNRMIPVIAIAVLFIAGCDKSATDTSKNVTKARADASQDVDEAMQDARETEHKADEKVADAQQAYAKTDATARAKLTKAESEAMITKAHADFKVSMAAAEGRNKIEVEKCGASEGVDKKACLSTADATFTADKASITANRDAVLVKAEHHG